MTDPLSLTVATLAFVEPALKAVKQAHGFQKLSPCLWHRFCPVRSTPRRANSKVGGMVTMASGRGGIREQPDDRSYL